MQVTLPLQGYSVHSAICHKEGLCCGVVRTKVQPRSQRAFMHLALLNADPLRSSVADVHQTLHCPLVLSSNVPLLVRCMCEVCLLGWPSLHIKPSPHAAATQQPRTCICPPFIASETSAGKHGLEWTCPGPEKDTLLTDTAQAAGGQLLYTILSSPLAHVEVS